MVIRVDEKDPVLLELLFARAYWNLDTYSEIPREDPRVPTRASGVPSPALASRWGQDWNERVTALDDGDTRPPATSIADPAQFNQWLAAQPQRWSDLLRADWPGDAYADWLESVLAPTRGIPLERSPERIAVDSLREAWSRGLREIVVIPVEGEYSRRLRDDAVLVSSALRGRADAYAEVLTAWR